MKMVSRLFLVLILLINFGEDSFARNMLFMGGSATPLVQGINFASGVHPPGWNGSIAPGASSTPVFLGGTNTTQNFEAQHTNESGQTITQVSTIDSAWYLTFTQGNEACSPNPFTVTRSIEYPPGTFTQITWGGGRTSLLIAPCANIQSDYDTLAVPIPAGATFYERIWVIVPAGQFWAPSGNVVNNEIGEIGVGLADKTMGGTITNGFSGSLTGLYRASAILTPKAGTTFNSIALEGDSISCGAGDNNFDANGNTGWGGRAASGNAPFMSLCVTGTTLANQVGHYVYRPDLLAKAGITHAVIGWGVNDVVSAPSLAALEAEATNIATKTFAAVPHVAWTTITPVSTTTQKWYNAASQTAGSGYGVGSVRAQFNAWLRTIPSVLFDYVENAWTVEETHDSGTWGTNPTLGTTALAVQDTWTVSGSPTATVFASNASRTGSYYSGGSVLFTSGVDSGLFRDISAYSGGQFTVASLGAAPSAGDTFIAYPIDMAGPISDGIHPKRAPNPGTGVQHGAAVIMQNNFTPQLQDWR